MKGSIDLQNDLSKLFDRYGGTDVAVRLIIEQLAFLIEVHGEHIYEARNLKRCALTWFSVAKQLRQQGRRLC
jgi:hypothetical protein